MGTVISKKKVTAIALAFAAAFNLAWGSLPARAETAQGANLNILAEEKISSGIQYTEEDISNYYNTGKRVRLNKLEVIPADGNTQIISGKAAETVNAIETIGDQAQREMLKGNQVVAGINADMYDMSTGMPNGLMVKDGQLVTSQGPDERNGSYRTSFYMDQNNKPGIASVHTEGKLTVGETVYDVNLLNRNQGVSDGLVIDTSNITRNHKLTHFYKGTVGNSAFALIRVDHFNGVNPGKDYIGTIEEIYTADGFDIPAGYVVLAGYGTMKSVVESLPKGDKVSFRYDLYVGADQNNNIATSVAFNTWLVRDGHALTASEMPDKSTFTTGPNARTALGIKADGSVIVVTVDKPSTAFSESIGASLPDLAKYLQEAGAVNALNLDGGGSTEMIVRKAGSDRPVTVNHPSDGNSRQVTNSLLFVSTAAKTGVVGHVVVDKNVTLYQGSSYDFSYRMTDEFGNAIKNAASTVQWETTFGSIDANGQYTAPKQPGSGNVTATVNGVKGSAKVTVVDSFASIAFTANNSVVMQQNETKPFDFKALDASGNQVIVDPSQAVWSLTGNIGTVSESGLVTAAAEHGTGTLTATIGGQTITASITVGLKEQVIDDFETYPIEGYHLSGYGYGNVTQYAGAAGTSKMLSISTDIKHSGNSSFKMDYDFSKWTKQLNGTLNWIPHWYTGSKWPNELAAQMDTTYKTDVYPKKFGMWVYGDGKAPWLRAIFVDGNNANKTIDLTSDKDDINWTGWKYIEVPIPQGWQLPIRLNYLYMVETDKSKVPYSGSVYFDDLKFLYTDDVTDFSGPEFTETTPSSNNVYGSTLDFSTVIKDNMSGVDKNRIAVKVNHADQAYTYDESTGRLSFKLENLTEGDYNVFVEAYDLASNQSVPWINKTYHVDLSADTEAPVISKVTPTSDVTVKIPTPRVTFKLVDEKSKVDAASISVKLNDASLPVYYDDSTGWGYAEPVKNLKDGVYTLTINAKDNVGNAMPTYTDKLNVTAIPQPKNKNNYSITVIPDTHLSPFAEPIFKRAAADDSSLIIHLGDIVDNGTQEQYDSAAESTKWFGSKPFFVMAGNHEAFQNTLDIYFKTFGSPTMQFEYGDTQIIILNSAFGQSISASDSTQFHYLEEVLAKNTKPNVLVFNHVVSRDGFGTMHEMNPSDVAKFESILGSYKAKHPKVDVYALFGHLHTLQSWEADGVKYIIGGNAANKTYVSHGDGDLLGSGKITVTKGTMNYAFEPLLTSVYIRNDAVMNGKMKAVAGSDVQLDLYGDFREYPSQYIAQLNNHELVDIDWSSSNEKVASVDENGVVTFNAVGSATITATSGGKSHSITVEAVDPADVHPVKLELGVSPEVKINKEIIPTIKATDAYGAVYALNPKYVTFSFQNGLITQAKNGKLRANAAGDEVITAQFGGLQAAANVTVVSKSEKQK
ncbi:phosphodiester glycosidase family protein [Cohnella pontilimi]|nr:phosphodiester glycosidase family protein [Cohnella pontilimi]